MAAAPDSAPTPPDELESGEEWEPVLDPAEEEREDTTPAPSRGLSERVPRRRGGEAPAGALAADRSPSRGAHRRSARLIALAAVCFGGGLALTTAIRAVAPDSPRETPTQEVARKPATLGSPRATRGPNRAGRSGPERRSRTHSGRRWRSRSAGVHKPAHRRRPTNTATSAGNGPSSTVAMAPRLRAQLSSTSSTRSQYSPSREAAAAPSRPSVSVPAPSSGQTSSTGGSASPATSTHRSAPSGGGEFSFER